MTKKSILLVDDEVSILDLVGESLEDEGYVVVRASSGVEALALLKRGDRFDLIVSDVSMPDGISGVDLAHAASELRSAEKIILASGRPTSELQTFPAGVAFLPKPYRLGQLLHVIQSEQT